MRLLFAGTPAVAVPVLEGLAKIHQISAILTRPPAPQGRSSRLVPSPVEAWGRDHRIEVLTPQSMKDPQFVQAVRGIAPQCCPVVAYGGLITPELLRIPTHGWINLHFSILPAYRGAAPVQRALLDGCTQTGITTFLLEPALDSGPVYLQQSVDIAPNETAGDLLDALAVLGAQSMAETMEMIEAGYQPTAQPDQGISYAPKITAEDARLDIGVPASRVVNRVRAMSPEPGAWALLGGQRFKILRARLADPQDVSSLAADGVLGRLAATKKHLFCHVRDGWIELMEVQAIGKKVMTGADWARGALASDPGAYLE